MPSRGALSVRNWDGQLVTARLWPRGRPEPDRESVHGLRAHARTLELAVPQPFQGPARNGDACGRTRFPLYRLGMGRLLARLDKGLHALLFLRPLAMRASVREYPSRWWPHRISLPSQSIRADSHREYAYPDGQKREVHSERSDRDATNSDHPIPVDRRDRRPTSTGMATATST